MKTGQRILVLTTSYPRFPGDFAGHFVQTEVQQLREQGHEVHVLAAGTSTANTWRDTTFLGGSRLFDHPGAWPRLKARPLRIVHLYQPTRALFALFDKKFFERFDRIVAHWLFPSALPWSTLFFPRTIPLQVVLHGTDSRLLCALPALLRKAMLHALVRRKATLRFVSFAQQRELLATGLEGPCRALVENAQVEPALAPAEVQESRAEARAALGLGQQARVALVVARLVESKRVATALAAAGLVPGLEIYVIGRGPLKRQLEDRFPQVRFLGFRKRPEVLLWMRAADLLISASRHEGAPTTVREALLTGAEVVASDCGDLKAWAIENGRLWVVD